MDKNHTGDTMHDKFACALLHRQSQRSQLANFGVEKMDMSWHMRYDFMSILTFVCSTDPLTVRP